MSYNGIGLTTPRGSGTNGYVVRNLSCVRPGRHDRPPPSAAADVRPPVKRKPNADILEHDRKRAIEVKCFALREELEELGDVDEEEVDRRVQELREKLTAESAARPVSHLSGAKG
ncbi:MAG: cwf21 domain-containing protein [Olpidium bornovanus]|uniref:Cwf21 domain-containing protein n=1 Tax=Olpidium bornovanus TaxID=278681 RepID=A0A8H8DLC6_9FUNG|nr:MAG: cwf21 domain-containing protein [Olpidium bornovanus]